MSIFNCAFVVYIYLKRTIKLFLFVLVFRLVLTLRFLGQQYFKTNLQLFKNS